MSILGAYPGDMGKAKKSRAVRVKFAQAKRLLSPKDCRLKGNIEKEELKRKQVCSLTDAAQFISGILVIMCTTLSSRLHRTRLFLCGSLGCREADSMYRQRSYLFEWICAHPHASAFTETRHRLSDEVLDHVLKSIASCVDFFSDPRAFVWMGA